MEAKSPQNQRPSVEALAEARKTLVESRTYCRNNVFKLKGTPEEIIRYYYHWYRFMLGDGRVKNFDDFVFKVFVPYKNTKIGFNLIYWDPFFGKKLKKQDELIVQVAVLMLENLEQAKLLFEQDEISTDDILHFLENKTVRVKFDDIQKIEISKTNNSDESDKKTDGSDVYVSIENLTLNLGTDQRLQTLINQRLVVDVDASNKTIVNKHNNQQHYDIKYHMPIAPIEDNEISDIDRNLENLIKADVQDFLDGLCSNGDIERFTQQMISFLNGKKLGKATPIKLKYGNPNITQQYIKTEVSHFTYKIWLTLKKKKILQKEISPHFFDTFGVNFPKTEKEDFMAKLKERYDEYRKIRRKKKL